jgi:hypothetical protein
MQYAALIIFYSDPFSLIAPARLMAARHAGFAAAKPPPRMPALLHIKRMFPLQLRTSFKY